jgi:uncharacterized protein (TIGR03067 family)
MKTLLCCILLAELVYFASGQSQTPSPFPGWAGKGGATPAPNTAAFDPAQLIGKWEGFVSTGDGSNPSQRSANVSLTITADKIVCSSAGSSGEGTYHITSSASKLHHIDGTGTGGIYQGKVYLGIFTLDGNTLKWCSTEGTRNRPTILRTNYGAGQYLVVLTRKP